MNVKIYFFTNLRWLYTKNSIPCAMDAKIFEGYFQQILNFNQKCSLRIVILSMFLDQGWEKWFLFRKWNYELVYVKFEFRIHILTEYV